MIKLYKNVNYCLRESKKYKVYINIVQQISTQV